MTGLAGDFATAYSDVLEPPKHFFYISFLTCLGNVLASSLTLNSSLGVEPRLYTLIVGESADDRKSTAIDKTVDFFKSGLERFEHCEGVGSAEGLQRRFKSTRYLLLFLDELASFIAKAKIQGSVLLPMTNTLFEKTSYSNVIKNKDILLEDAHLSLLAASTTDTFENMLDSAFKDIGFNNRLLIVPGTGQRKNPIPKPIPDTVKKGLRQRLSELVDAI